MSELAEWKLKLSQKTSTDDAVDQLISRFFDTFDYGTGYADYVTTDTLLSGFYSSLMLGIPLADVVPWQLLFQVELPSPEEYIQGVLLEIRRVPPEQVLPQLETIDQLLGYVFEPEWSGYIQQQIPGKAVYGRSRYDQSYFDPTAVANFLRSTAYAFAKKGTSDQAVRAKIRAAAEVLGIEPALAEDLHNRLAMFSAAKAQGALANYAWVDATELTDGRVRFRAYDGSEVEVEVDGVLDALVGCYADLSFADLCFATPGDYYRYYPLRYDPSVAQVALEYMVSLFSRGFRERYLVTPLLIANYQTAEQRARAVTDMAERYSVPTSHRLALERAVDSFLDSRGAAADPVTRNLYRVAVLDLYGSLYGVHRWGDEMQRSMTRVQLKEFWVRRWSEAGLDASLLPDLFDAVIGTVDALGAVRMAEVAKSLRRRLQALRSR